MNCPKCGGIVNPSTRTCKDCGSFITKTNEVTQENNADIGDNLKMGMSKKTKTIIQVAIGAAIAAAIFLPGIINNQNEYEALKSKGAQLESQLNDARAGVTYDTAPAITQTDVKEDILKLDAYNATINYIKERLLSPGAGEFQPYSDNMINKRVFDGKDQYSVTMWADCENPYGVKIRNKFWIIVQHDAVGWSLIQFSKLD